MDTTLLVPVRYDGRRRLLLLALLLTALGTVGFTQAGPASAHASLVSSSPKDNSRVATLPDKVVFHFDENVGSPAYVIVKAPDGSTISHGKPVTLDNTVTQVVTPNGEAGTYSMAYRVVSADGHPVTDQLSFQVTRGKTVTAPTSNGPVKNESFVRRHAVHLVIALLVLVVGGGLLWRGSRDRA
jgi:methionine-rich copper-binding protein CopC